MTSIDDSFDQSVFKFANYDMNVNIINNPQVSFNPEFNHFGQYPQQFVEFGNNGFINEPLQQLQPPFQPQPLPNSYSHHSHQHQPQSQSLQTVFFNQSPDQFALPVEVENDINSYDSHQLLISNESQNFFMNENGFPPVDAFAPPHVHVMDAGLIQAHMIPTPIDQQQHRQFTPQQLHQSIPTQPFPRSRYLSEPNLMTPMNIHESFNVSGSEFSSSPDSITFGSSTSQGDSNTTIPSSPEYGHFKAIKSDTNTTRSTKVNIESSSSTHNRYRVIRGISSGGSATKPPRVLTQPNHHYEPVNLEIIMATLEDLCLPKWNEFELADKRRIIRIERYQIGPKIVAEFSIVGSAKENPTVVNSDRVGVDVVEVSCLECFTRPSDDLDEDEEAEEDSSNSYSYRSTSDYPSEVKRSFYITSVEVIKIVELLIGTESQDPVDRRRERGRIRSNLVPFWSKKPISSRIASSTYESLRGSPIPNESNVDFRVELATRIMAYEIRKPRGFDKEVRILKWEKLIPALRRALQSYYAEIPDNFKEEDEEEED